MSEDDEVKREVEKSDVENWIFSLTPVGIAFAFYIMFILTSDIQNKDLFMAIGAAAGIIGLEAYWVLRGWSRNRISTVIMGILGIAITLGLLMLYTSTR